MNVIIDQQKVTLGKLFAEGGEAEIYKIPGSSSVVKLFKQATHATYAQEAVQQQGARMRLQEYQLKLKSFPPHVPKNVIAPQRLVYDQKGQVIGYVMPFVDKAFPLIRYSDKSFREQSGIDEQQVLLLFRFLQQQVVALHNTHIVLGDFNDLNVLVRGLETYLIDTDSYQFGKFLSHTFTQTFLDPLLAYTNPHGQFDMKLPYQVGSDWYAYAVMLMQSLLYVGPYGGVYMPKDPKQKIAQTLRPLQRITVFDPAVKYPKAAIPYAYLPDDLLQWFWNIFCKDMREPLPEKFFQDVHWVTCPTCSTRHARGQCPICHQVVPGLVKQTITVQGNLVLTKVLETQGVILLVKLQQGKLRWLVYDKGAFVREDKQLVAHGDLHPTARYAIKATSTLLAKDTQITCLDYPHASQLLYTEQYQNIPVFGANSTHYYWIQAGDLMRDASLGPERIGSVLSEKTFFWVGETFGFGISREGMFQMAFLFDAETKGILEVQNFPKLPGRIIDAAATFTDQLCWYFYTMEHRGALTTACVVVDRQGIVLAHIIGDGTEPWLQHIHGKSAFGTYLFSATDEGILRLTVNQGTIGDAKLFAATEQLVDTTTRLLVADGGIYAIHPHKIVRIKFT